jgi:hypothetical protein
MRKGSRTLAPFLVKLQQYVDTRAASAEHVVVEPLLHDDDDWRVYLQGYTDRTRTRVMYASPPPPEPSPRPRTSVGVPLPTGSDPQHLSKFFYINSN